MEVMEQLDPELKALADLVLEITPFDVALTEGHRGEAKQMAAFLDEKSKLKWPDSKHNSYPSLAMHLDPFPIRYEKYLKYYLLAGVVHVAAKDLGVEIRWGGDWDSDFDMTDQQFNDLAHYELRGERP